jgi:membrane protein DedA with SNARE-associated domain
MIETILALVPDYGLILVFFVVLLACLAAPLPASVLVLTAGSFAASGDLSLSMTLITTCLAFVIGDQIAFALAGRLGSRLMPRFAQSPRVGPILKRSEALLQRHGALAVFLSHTILSPTCPYISYLSGAGGLSWRVFSAVAIPGALVWSAGYVGLGYVFASQLDQVATLLSNFFGVVLALAIAIGALLLLKSRWADRPVSEPQTSS